MRRVLLTVAAVSMMVISACSTSGEEFTPEYGNGRMSIGFSTSSVVDITSSEDTQMRSTTSTTELPEQYVPAADDFSLVITGTYWDPTDEVYMDFYEEYENLSTYNSMEVDEDDSTLRQPPYLVAGEYKAVMESGAGVNVESSTNAQYYGEVEFTIVARENDSEATITATMQNSIVQLKTTDYFKSYFGQGATLKLSTMQGTTLTIDTTVDGSEDQILFVAPGTTLFLEGVGVKQDPGNGSSPTVTFGKSSIGTTTKRTWSTVIVDADDAGGEKISITLDDSYTEINETDVDLH